MQTCVILVGAKGKKPPGLSGGTKHKNHAHKHTSTAHTKKDAICRAPTAFLMCTFSSTGAGGRSRGESVRVGVFLLVVASLVQLVGLKGERVSRRGSDRQGQESSRSNACRSSPSCRAKCGGYMKKRARWAAMTMAWIVEV